MKIGRFAFVLALAIVPALLVSGCIQPAVPRVIQVPELLENAESYYGKQAYVSGKVSELGELFCSCFRLTSGGQSVQVWYDTMVTDDGTEMPAVSMEGISNGDDVVVTGILQRGGTHASPNDFWAKSIGKGGPIIGGDEYRHLCNEDERNVEACIEIYQPVCGWSDPEKVQCLAWPCASTYSNSCFACMDENVKEWTAGQCPVDDKGCNALCIDQNYREGTCKASEDILVTDYGLGIDCIDDSSGCSRIQNCKCACNEYVAPEINESITDFDSCVAAGNPVLESHPRRCLTMDGRSFTEGQPAETVSTLLTGEQAKAIAEASNCTENGTLAENGTVSYNQFTKTWWFDLDMNPEAEKTGCNPACVVWDETNETEINWRCTGLLQ